MDENHPHPIDDVRVFAVPFASGESQRMLVCRLVVSKEMTDAIVALASASHQPLADAVKGMLVAHLTTLGVFTVSPERER